MAKSLDGKVALVTGAGQGLGRAEALYLASEGAKVVVNDLGASVEGEGRESKPAQAVVEEIKAAGGEAVAHGGDVSSYDDAKDMIDLAIKEFGDFHILINNAGILRDRMIFNITEGEWDAVVKVHLKGHFNTTRHACAYWREQSKVSGNPAYGRIVNTSSEAFLMGSPGQPNYAAAKAGIVGLTTSTAQAMAKYGVTSNAIAPPQHIVTSAVFLSERSSSCKAVVMRRAPVAPTGCPIAIAPPLTLMRSMSASCTRWNDSTTDANASLISMMSMSLIFMPLFARIARVASTGPSRR